MPSFNTSRLRAAQSQLRTAANQLRSAGNQLQSDLARLERESRQASEQLRANAAHAQRELQRLDSQQRQAVARYNTNASALNRQLRSASEGPRYTPTEQALADRMHDRVIQYPERDYDVFLSYARLDGSASATALKDALESLGVSVWFDEVSIVPGLSQARQMDKGLRSARCGVALITPTYLAGRFWIERELGVLLSKQILIPVLDKVTFAQVAEYSGILPDLAGFETARDTIQVIAEKIAAAVLPADENAA